MAAAALLSFALSIDDYIITSFVAGDRTTTFPMQIFNANKVEIPPQVQVLATMILIFTLGLMAIGAAGARSRRDAVRLADLVSSWSAVQPDSLPAISPSDEESCSSGRPSRHAILDRRHHPHLGALP